MVERRTLLTSINVTGDREPTLQVWSLPPDAAGLVRAAIEGECCSDTSAAAARALAGVFDAGTGDVELDLRGLTFLDGRGASVLADLAHRCQRRGGCLTLRHLDGPPRRVVDAVALDRLVRVADGHDAREVSSAGAVGR